MHSVYAGAWRGPKAALLITTVGVDRTLGVQELYFPLCPSWYLHHHVSHLSMGGPVTAATHLQPLVHGSGLLGEDSRARAFPCSEKVTI